MKREGRPSETATLNSRLIDRPIRPMFPKGVQNEIQIISTILSSSGATDSGFWGITGASLSLMLAGVSDFEGPVAGVRIAMNTAGEFIFDPSAAELKSAKLDLTIAGTLDAITMVESQALEIDESTMSRAFSYAHGVVQEICRAQLDFLTEYQKTHALPVVALSLKEDDENLKAQVAMLVNEERVRPLFFTGKTEFYDRLHDLEQSVLGDLGYDPEATESVIDVEAVVEAVYATVKSYMRASVLDKRIRLDGRAPEQVRPLRSAVGILPRTHGSGLFERGVTQVLSVTTLGGP